MKISPDLFLKYTSAVPFEQLLPGSSYPPGRTMFFQGENWGFDGRPGLNAGCDPALSP